MKFSGNWHFRSCDDAAFLSASHDASHRAQGYNSPANKHAHIKFPKPHPVHTWYTIWMLREPKWVLRLLEHALPIHTSTWGWIRKVVYITLDAAAKRICSWRNGAVVAGMFDVRWDEMSATVYISDEMDRKKIQDQETFIYELMLKWEEKTDRKEDRLEYKMRGACVSILCERGCCFIYTVDRLATNWVASWSDMESKNVRVVVISSKTHSKIRSNELALKIGTHGTHGRQLYSFLEIVKESNSKMKTRKKVQCYT